MPLPDPEATQCNPSPLVAEHVRVMAFPVAPPPEVIVSPSAAPLPVTVMPAEPLDVDETTKPTPPPFVNVTPPFAATAPVNVLVPLTSKLFAIVQWSLVPAMNRPPDAPAAVATGIEVAVIAVPAQYFAETFGALLASTVTA